jgi:hypothetical protein
MMPDAVVTYAADWSEYFGHQPADGSGDVFYHLDPLWASPSIDVVGIDNYLPLADRRDDELGEDAAPSDYDVPALRAGIAGGEYFDWYYASDADRAAGLPTLITDGAAGKPWVFRPKDFAGWWSNPHVERRGGIETAGTSLWVPMSKPIWFTELGCPAINRGPNQPNVFVDPKSSESFVPHASAGGRDDLVQRRFLEAQLGFWDPASPDFDAANNPLSPVYGGRMVNATAIHLWTWDARPYPAFPERTDIWSDGGNWRRGHWLSGRLANAPVDALVAAILDDHGVGDYNVSAVEASVTGFVVPGPETARRSLEELMRLTGTLAHVSAGRLVFRSLARVSTDTEIGTFVDGEGAYVERRRGEAGETAEEIALAFLDPARAYQPGSAEAVRAGAAHPRKEIVELPVVLEEGQARELAAAMLQEAAAVSQSARFAVAPSLLGLEPGDVVSLAERPGDWLVMRIETGEARRIEARLLPPRRRAWPDQGDAGPLPQPGRPTSASRPVVHLLDLPLPEGGEGIAGARFAVVAKPWIPYAVTAARAEGAQVLRAAATRPATAGRLISALAPGPVGVIDRANRPRVRLHRGALASIAPEALLDGGNLCAIECAPGLWEVLQFETAEEVGPGEFELGRLLRAQGGTEDAMASGAAADAAFVLLDAGAGELGLTSRDVGRSLDWRIAPLGRPLDDPAVVTLAAALGGRSVKPLSPVHLRGTFAADGSLVLRWVRRTRIGGDGWDGLDVPLGEERELYRIEISDGTGALLLREADGPALSVPAGELAAAFGPLHGPLTVSVAQVSPQWGPGTARSTLLSRP